MNETLGLELFAERIKLDLPIPVTEIVSAGYLSRSTLLRMRQQGLPTTKVGHRVCVRFSDLENWSTDTQNKTGKVLMGKVTEHRS